MIKKIFFLNLILVLGFAFAQDYQNYKLFLSSDKLYQGDVLIVKLSLPNQIAIQEAYLGKIKINFIQTTDNQFIAFVGIGAKEKPGNYKLNIYLTNNEKIERSIKIYKRNFPITELKTTPELEKKGYTPQRIVNNLKYENEIVNNITSRSTNQIYFKQKFQPPLKQIKIVGDYGNIRKNGNNEVQHLGVDLDGKLGDSVYAMNEGKAVLAKKLINYGNTIIIDHGGGIYSLYLHLNKIYVNENQYVKPGQIIGEVGNTGYSLEPHLHLSIKVNNQSIDPMKFLTTANNFLFSEIKSTKVENFNLQANIHNLMKKISWGYEENHQREIDTIIIHSSYNPFGNDYYNVNKILQIYKNYGVSAHYLIDRQGNIYQLVDEKNIAYHAGKSKMPDGRTGVNYFSIGIELIYHKNESPNEIQYASLNRLIKDIKSRHNIKYILGHQDIAPERKDDPWNFDWNKIEK
jgi:murein DD-endopeptidase MepM/ murein hydrolase activator NlpD